jgi:putative ABC transport system permease protein
LAITAAAVALIAVQSPVIEILTTNKRRPDYSSPMLQDVRHALRLMASQKAFTAAALVTCALGIGATTAIFSMVYGVLLRPLPYANADRLVRVSEIHQGGTPVVRSPMLSNYTYYAWSDMRTLEGVAAYRSSDQTLTIRSQPSRVSGAAVSPALFRLLGARALLGRTLRDEDASGGAADVVVLSNALWQERFGDAPFAQEQAIQIDGKPHVIVGVMPADFYFPTRAARFWIPYRIPPRGGSSPRDFWVFSAVGVLRAGATTAQAAAEGTTAARSAGPRPMAAELLLGKGAPVLVQVEPLLHEMTARVRPALLVLLASVVLVLLIACANVTHLLLSRGVARRRELAVRMAIGAGQGRVTRQLLIEALVLSLLGGALGAILGWLLTRAIPALAPEDFPRLTDIRMDNVALAFAAGASVVAGLLAGTLPAVRLGRGGLLTALREGTGASASAQARRLGTALLVCEAAVAVMLLVGAGLLGRSFFRLLQVDPGYDAGNVLMARVHLPPQTQLNEGNAFAEALLARVRALPGVTTAGAANMAPLIPMSAVISLTLAGESSEPITARARSYVVTPGYAEALSLRVREGRVFQQQDSGAGIHPILINEEFARVHFRDGTPVGRRFKASFMPDAIVEIVGVVANVLKDGLDAAPEPEIYNLPHDPFGFGAGINVAMRTAGEPLALAAAFRETVRGLSATAAVDEIETLGSRVSASVSQPRFAMAVLVVFAALGLVLAAVGLYGVLSYQVLQRRRELGVRAALGASRANLVRMVMRQGIMIAACGIVLGLLGAAWLAGLMQALLFGVTPHDAVAFSAAPIALLLVAIAATLIPARRAAAADPIEALRAE